MSNEFYIMATIVAVGFVIWLYKKGKQIVFWTRKISRTFKGIRINPKSLLNDQQCKKSLSEHCMHHSKAHIKTR